jgi:hypothetical protein
MPAVVAAVGVIDVLQDAWSRSPPPYVRSISPPLSPESPSTRALARGSPGSPCDSMVMNLPSSGGGVMAPLVLAPVSTGPPPPLAPVAPGPSGGAAAGASSPGSPSSPSSPSAASSGQFIPLADFRSRMPVVDNDSDTLGAGLVFAARGRGRGRGRGIVFGSRFSASVAQGAGAVSPSSPGNGATGGAGGASVSAGGASAGGGSGGGGGGGGWSAGSAGSASGASSTLGFSGLGPYGSFASGPHGTAPVVASSPLGPSVFGPLLSGAGAGSGGRGAPLVRSSVPVRAGEAAGLGFSLVSYGEQDSDSDSDESPAKPGGSGSGRAGASAPGAGAGASGGAAAAAAAAGHPVSGVSGRPGVLHAPPPEPGEAADLGDPASAKRRRVSETESVPGETSQL